MILPGARFAAVSWLALSSLCLAEQPWVSLFNGKNLDGWTPKVSGHALGENPFNTFRVEAGVLKVSYDGYDKFDEQYGHLYSNIAYSRNILRYQKPQLDPEGRIISADALFKAGAPKLLDFGHIALQAEGQGVWFRNIELKSLEEP